MKKKGDLFDVFNLLCFKIYYLVRDRLEKIFYFNWMMLLDEFFVVVVW